MDQVSNRSLLLICSEMGSDCGIVNVNIPTNGAEIGGAFGMIVYFNNLLKAVTRRQVVDVNPEVIVGNNT